MYIVFCFALFLFFPIIWAQALIPVQDATCPFSHGTPDLNVIPQIESLNYCNFEGPNVPSCCTQEYINEIAAPLNVSDYVIPALANFFSPENVTQQCVGATPSLLCMPCRDDTWVWTQILSGINQNSYRVKICADYCNSLYVACSNSVVASTHTLVSRAYSTPGMFCSALFRDSRIIINVVPSTDITCYDPNKRRCTADDINYFYTECIDEKRSLRYNWKFNITCNGGVKLPRSRNNLICPISCPAGTYLPLGSNQCRPCSPGTYSLGGGVRVEEWNSWPSRGLVFRTYCLDAYNRLYTTGGCSGWQLNDTMTDSNIAGRQSTKSVLETEVTVKQNSTISFVAQVDSEYSYDKLIFDVDGRQQWIGNTIDPVRSQFSLSPGFHRLKWIYSKDASLDYGEDHAIIFMIEVTALADHSDFCTSCRVGYSSPAQATSCTMCLENQYTNSSGSPQCLQCPDDAYSLPGDDHCTPREECTASDIDSYYSVCFENNTRTKHYRWIEPQICIPMSVQLPLDEPNLPCLPCNPGEYRDGLYCVTCPLGQWSAIGAASCTSCDPGTYAPKQLNLHTWDEWPSFLVTGCQGQCGTSGWRLRSTFIDSGTNHGRHAASYLTVPTMIEAQPYGYVSYNVSLHCQGWCYLEFYDGVQFVHTKWNDIQNPGGAVEVGPFPFTPGPHNFTWTFGKFYGQRNNDHAEITEITISGVAAGGAAQCYDCNSGTASSEPSDRCSLCPAGYYSTPRSTQCTPCEENQYQDTPGQGQCKPCGAGTYTPSGSTYCNSSSCVYSPPGTTDTYDLNGLSLDFGMYGPVEERRYPPQYYYINPCKKQNQTSLNMNLTGADGTVITTYAASLDVTSGLSVDLGHIVGYYPYPGPEKGVIMEFTEGTAGCGDELVGQEDVPRKLNLTIICDYEAGIGVPEDPVPIYTGTVYPNVCTYHLIWRSLYGCPICTTNDYTTITEVCQGDQQVVRHVWKSHPPNCHDGIRPPEPYVRNCTTIATCSVGTHLSVNDLCVPCLPGEYSLGNGPSYDAGTFSDPTVLSKPPFSTNCSGPGCLPWSAGGGVLESGSSGRSWVIMSQKFKSPMDSSITFYYKYTSQGSPFQFLVDGVKVLEVTKYAPGYKKYSYALPVGTHSFRWEYNHTQPIFASQRDNYVLIKDILVRGTVNAVTTCTPCPPGTISDDNKGYCHPCSINQYIEDDPVFGPRCVSCGDEFRLVGQPTCLPRPVCTDDDFVERYPGVETHRCGITSIFAPKQPQICTGPDPEGVKKDCLECPSGMHIENTTLCSPCTGRTYLNFGSCQQVSPGNTAVLISHFFTPTDYVDEPPKEFSTECFGNCNEEDDGWRLYGNYADSGLHYGEVDSVLYLKITTDKYYYSVPTLGFTVTVNPVSYLSGQKRKATNQGGIELYIDGVIQEMPFIIDSGIPVTKTFQIFGEKGVEHTIMWVYSQEDGDIPAVMQLTDVKVVGSQSGLATQEINCPAGTYSDSNSNCLPCKPGYYSLEASSQCNPCAPETISGPGAASCTQCPSGTQSIKNSCQSNCRFIDPNGNNYYLDSLKGDIVTIIPAGDQLKNYYEINLCDKFISDDCQERKECSENSYIFGQFLDEEKRMPRTLGTWLEFIPLEVSQPQGAPSDSKPVSLFDPHTFDLVYTRGTNLPPGCTSVNTTIQFWCSLHEGKGIPQAEIQDNCFNVFRWKSTYACRVCKPEDQIVEEGPCLDGERLNTVRYKVPCNGQMLATYMEACEDIEVAQTTVIMGVSVGIVLLVVGLGCAIYFFCQKRSVEAKYERLRNEVNAEDQEDVVL